MYNGVIPVVGTGVVGGSLATTGFHTLFWVAVSVALIAFGLVLVRVRSVTRGDGD